MRRFVTTPRSVIYVSPLQRARQTLQRVRQSVVQARQLGDEINASLAEYSVVLDEQERSLQHIRILLDQAAQPCCSRELRQCMAGGIALLGSVMLNCIESLSEYGAEPSELDHTLSQIFWVFGVMSLVLVAMSKAEKSVLAYEREQHAEHYANIYPMR